MIGVPLDPRCLIAVASPDDGAFGDERVVVSAAESGVITADDMTEYPAWRQTASINRDPSPPPISVSTHTSSARGHSQCRSACAFTRDGLERFRVSSPGTDPSSRKKRLDPAERVCRVEFEVERDQSSASSSASTSSDTSPLANTFCTSSESSSASMTRNIFLAPSLSSGTSTVGSQDDSAES